MEAGGTDVERVVEDSVRFWRIARVPARQRDRMADELRRHMATATRRGEDDAAIAATDPARYAAAWRRGRDRHVWADVVIDTLSVSSLLAAALFLGASRTGNSGVGLTEFAVWIVGMVALVTLVQGVIVAVWDRVSTPAALMFGVTLVAVGAWTGSWVNMAALEPVVEVPVAVPVGLLAVALASRMIWWKVRRDDHGPAADG